MKKAKERLAKALGSLDQTEGAVWEEERRIVKEFIDLLRWIRVNVSPDIYLPFGDLSDSGTFQCIWGSDQDEVVLNLNEQNPGLNLDSTERNVIIQILKNGFVNKLIKSIKASNSESRKELTKLKKIRVPSSL